MELGRRLSQWRDLWGFSQRELARRADITNGTLSQIEQGNTSPSIQTVQKLASAFGIDLQTLMFVDPYPPVMIRTEGSAPLLPLSKGTAGVYSFDAMAPTFSRIQVSPGGVLEYAEILAVIQGDAKSGLTPSAEWLRLYVISGELTLELAGRAVSLLAGDAACLPAGQPFMILCANQASELLLLTPFHIACST